MTNPVPEQSGIPAEGDSTSKLLRDLRIEFGPRCNRTVEFIRSAHWVLRLEPHDDLPRQGEIVAYCLREAVDTLKTALDGDSRLGEESMKRYVRFYRQASSDLHGELSRQKAADLYADIILFLRQQFHRREDLESLARVISPRPSDVEEACQLIGNPTQLEFFLSEAGIEWLDPLTENGFLDLTVANGGAPFFHVVRRFGSTHPERVAEWLRSRWTALSDETLICTVASAALNLKRHGAQLLLDIISAHPRAFGVMREAELALDNVDPFSQHMWQLADRLLSYMAFKYRTEKEPSMYAEETPYYAAYKVVNALISGMNTENAMQRIRLIAWTLEALPLDDFDVQSVGSMRVVTVADFADSEERDFVKVLVGAWIQAARRAKPWTPTDCLIKTLEKVPKILAARMRAWLLSSSDDISEKRLIAEVAESINCRLPTGDDLLLVERIERNNRETEILSPWREALGAAPSIPEVDEFSAANDVPERWHRVHKWCSILPDGVTDRWRPVSARLAAKCGKFDRAAYRETPNAETGVFVGSPIDEKLLESLPPLEASAKVAAWRPTPGDCAVKFFELGKTLGTVVAKNPAVWSQSPIEVVKALHQPRYITAYLAALTIAIKENKSMPVSAGKFVETIELMKTEPWKAIQLGDEYNYNTDWRGTVRAGVNLLRVFAEKCIGYEGRNDGVWTIFSEEARQHDKPMPAFGDGLMADAANRPRTSALQAVLSFMKHEYRAAKKVRPEALALLDEALRLDGDNGLQHRAILAPNVGLLHSIAPEWMEERRELLFGSEAPDDMGQRTLELALEWGTENRWVSERFGGQLRKSVKKGAPRAMMNLVSAMLAGVPGYSATAVLSFLDNVKNGISNAASELGQLLRDNPAIGLSTAVAFWQEAIKRRKANLKGFGWMAAVCHFDDGKWSELTLCTLQRTKGAIDRAEKVAERVSALPPDPTRLRIMDFLVRNADPWSKDLINDINEKAVDLLRSATELESTDEYRRLRMALLERGLHLDGR